MTSHDPSLPSLDGQTTRSKLNHLYARIEAQTYRIGKNTDSIERMEKTLERLTNALISQTHLLSEYNRQLEIHMARSDALERITEHNNTETLRRIAEQEGRLSSIPLRVLQIISIFGGLAALIRISLEFTK